MLGKTKTSFHRKTKWSILHHHALGFWWRCIYKFYFMKEVHFHRFFFFFNLLIWAAGNEHSSKGAYLGLGHSSALARHCSWILILLFLRSPTEVHQSFSNTKSPMETFSHLLFLRFCHALPQGQHKSKPILLEKLEHIWVKEKSLSWPTLIIGCYLTLKEKNMYIYMYIYMVRSFDKWTSWFRNTEDNSQ